VFLGKPVVRKSRAEQFLIEFEAGIAFLGLLVVTRYGTEHRYKE
jgi:hypothetical protein